jgi:hypothetical protein
MSDIEEDTTVQPNDQMALIVGFSSTGKSASLRNIRNQERWAYANTEAGKRLPFKNKFMNGGFRIEDPYQVHEMFDAFTNDDNVDGAIIDSITFLMDMYETMYVLNAANTMKAWGDFAQFFKILMQQKVTTFAKPVLMTAHVLDVLDEKAMEMKTSVPIKGSLKNNGVEAYFSTVVAAKKIQIKDLEPYSSSILNITDEERELGYKHVFQTRPTKSTVGERLRSPMGMFTKAQTFMDNDAQLLLDHLHDFYKH